MTEIEKTEHQEDFISLMRQSPLFGENLFFERDKCLGRDIDFCSHAF